MGKCSRMVAANAVPNCEHPLVKGYTGRAIGFVLDPNTYLHLMEIMTFDANKNLLCIDAQKIEALFEGTNPFAIENAFPNVADRLAGSQTQSNADDGVMMFSKTFAFKAMQRGGGFSYKFVDAIAGCDGVLIIAEKVDKVGDGSYEVIGWHDSLRVNADGINRAEATTAGTTITMSCAEPYFETALALVNVEERSGDVVTDYFYLRSLFEELFNTIISIG